MNSSGPISLGGTTAGQSIELENGGPGTVQVSLNDTAVRNLAGVPSGAIIMPTNFYGKSNRVSLSFTISSNTYTYDVFSVASASPSYIAGKSDITVNVSPGVLVGSTSTGSYAMLVPSAFNSGDTITIVNNGFILGTGGNGGTGGSGAGGASAGGAGGNALYVNIPTTVTNNGTVGSGGGGGGGGSGGGPPSRGQVYGGGGGGGGAGYNGGSGGAGGAGAGPTGGSNGGLPGGAGTPTTGGGGGGVQPNSTGAPGGPGGGLGAAGTPKGASGGATGKYITGNAFVTWPATGTRLGGVA